MKNLMIRLYNSDEKRLKKFQEKNPRGRDLPIS